MNVLLGPTRAGKTSLLRLFAGLDAPSAGRVLEDGRDVTGVSVRRRNLAMVYQQFINYPALTVFENIASPLRLQRRPADEIRSRVGAIAEKLHISHLLQRLPAELSGGQQQRTALARALVKRAPLVLLDEPLVNLDYKLREERRSELASLFADGETTVVYTTTEPLEAMLLGGRLSVVDAGRILQTGPIAEVMRRPASVDVAAILNDPPINILPAAFVKALGLKRDIADDCLVGLQPFRLRLAGAASANGGASVAAKVELAELNGSETLLHLRAEGAGEGARMVAQLPGLHSHRIGEAVQARIDADSLFVFDASGRLQSAPDQTREAAHGAH